MIRCVCLAMCILFSGAIAWSKPQPYLTLYGEPPKYAESFQAFTYVNPDAPKGGMLKLGAIGTFDSLNPFIIKGTPAAGLTPLYPSLLYVTLMAHSHEEPFTEYAYAAETADLAEDRRSVTFVLKPGITFHDGSPITAEDVAFSFQQLREKGNPLYRNYYGDVTAVVVVNPRTIRFEFKDASNRELPLILGQFPIFSKAFYIKHPFDKANLTIPLGNGPYRIKKIEAGHQVAYERVKNWWGENLPVNKGRYNFDEIIYQYFRDADVAFEAFKSGEYDFRQEARISNWVQRYNFPAMRDGQVLKIEVPNKESGVMNGLIFNTRRPLFQDRRVRQALTAAFNFEWINKTIFFGKYKRCYSYFSGTELAASPQWTEREYEILKPFAQQMVPEVLTKPFVVAKTDGTGENRAHLKEAKALLKKAGWEIHDGKLVHSKTKEPFVFEVMIQQADLIRVFQDFVQDLKVLGIEVKLRLVETAQYINRLNSFDYDAIFLPLGQSLSPGNEQREFWTSRVAKIPGSRNYAGIQDLVVDKLVEALINSDTRDELVFHTKALDRVLLWGFYVLPMQYSDKSYYAYWKHLAHSGRFPQLGLDIQAFWAVDMPQKKRP